MSLDEIEISTAIKQLRSALTKMDNKPLQEVIDSIVDLIESAHERIDDYLSNEDEDE